MNKCPLQASSDRSTANRRVDYDYTAQDGTFVLPRKISSIPRDDFGHGQKLYANRFCAGSTSKPLSASVSGPSVSDSLKNLVHSYELEGPEPNANTLEVYSSVLVSYISINSAQRRTKTEDIYGPLFYLSSDSISIHHSTELELDIETGPNAFKIGQSLTFQNVTSPCLMMTNALSLRENSVWMYLRHSKGSQTDYLNDTINLPELIQSDHDSSVYHMPASSVSIDGLKGDFVANIPTYTLNGQHQFYHVVRRQGESYQIDTESCAIRLPFVCSKSLTYVGNILVRFSEIGGLDLSIFGLRFEVIKKSEETIRVRLATQTQCAIRSSKTVGLRFGGPNAFICPIIESRRSYPNPNSYEVILDKSFRNVVRCRIVGSSFPNTHHNITSLNNCFYWRDQFSSRIKQISLTPGFYDCVSLERGLNDLLRSYLNGTDIRMKVSITEATGEVKVKSTRHVCIGLANNVSYSSTIIKLLGIDYAQSLFFVPSGQSGPDCMVYECERKGQTETVGLKSNRRLLIDVDNKSCVNDLGSNLSRCHFTSVINLFNCPYVSLTKGDLIVTDLFEDGIRIYEVGEIVDTGKLYKLIECPDSIVVFGNNLISRNSLSVISDMSYESVAEVGPSGQCQLKVPNHLLSVGQTICIDGTTCVVNRIIDSNSLVVNADQSILKSATVYLELPCFFQLLFDQPNSIGYLLGFDLPQSPFAPVIRNISDGKCCLRLSDTTVSFYLRCPELGTGIPYISNTNPVDNVFALIRRYYNDYNGYSFDSFVPTTKVLDPPIDILNRLTISFLNPDGTPVDFGEKNHSFVLEVTELYNVPNGTDISARINSEIVMNRV